MRRVAVLVAFTFGVVLAVSVPAFAEPAAVDFVDNGPVQLTAGGQTGIAVVSNVGSSLDVVLTVTMADGSDAATYGPVRLDPGGVRVVTVAAPGSAGAGGFLILTSRGAAAWTVARRPFMVASTVQGWKPLVATWQVTSLRGPVAHGLGNDMVPLVDGESCGSTDSTTVVGGLVRTSGGSAVVTAHCRAGERQVGLTVDGLADAGDYTGTVDLAPGVDGGELELTVRHTDDPVYPLVLLVAGIALALVAAWQANRLSSLSQAQEEAWQVEADAATAHERFRAAGQHTTWGAYTFLTALTAELTDIRNQLGRMRWQLGELPTDKGPFRVQLDRLIRLRTLVDGWEAFAVRLRDLAAARQALSLTPGQPVPAIAVHADSLLGWKKLADVDDVPPLLADVDATLAAVRAWPADTQAVAGLQQLVAKIERSVDEDGRPLLAEVAAKVDDVRDRLWSASDGAAYLRINVSEQLAEPTVQLNALRKRYPGLQASGTTPEDLDMPAPARQTAVPSVLRQAQESAATARRIARTRRLRNGLVFVALAAVTVWTGLSALYFDHAFGTWRDYVAAAVWGFGAQAGLTVLASALDRIIAATPLARP